MSDIFNTSLAKDLVKSRISSRESETVVIHGIGIKYHKTSHKPKSIIVHYDLYRKCGKGRRLMGKNKEKQIKLRDLDITNRYELFHHPITIWTLKEKMSTSK